MCYHSQRLPFCFFLYFSLSFTSSFSFITHFLSLLPFLYSSLPSKSKSCVAIATAAVCKNYLNPSLFSLSLTLFLYCVFPVTFNGYCFDVGTNKWVGGEKERGERLMLGGTLEQSSRAERGEEGLEVEKPGGQTGSQWAGEKKRKKNETESKHRQGQTQKNSQSDGRADT